MEYNNPPIEEGINYSNEHPLKEFVQLLIGVAVLIVTVVLVLNFAAGSLAKRIPFVYEQTMAANFDLLDVFDDEHSQNVDAADFSPRQSAAILAKQVYLQSIADKLVPAMNLPSDMQVTLHYKNSSTVNAFATLGGHIVFFEGLLDKLESEDELAAVMGHEIAHVKLRHPIVALGKGLTIAALAAFISGASGSSAGDWLIGNSAKLSLLKFSRDQEAAADAESAAALAQVYGHIGGADALFQHFAEIERNIEKTNLGKLGMIEMFRSHPYSEKRWQNLQALAAQKAWLTEGVKRPLAFPDSDYSN